METLRERISSVFQVQLPINRGSGRSIVDPVVVRSEEEDAHIPIMQQWMHFKGLLEEKQLTVFRTVPIVHHGRHLIRVDVRCNAGSLTTAESKTEHFYFDVSCCIHQIPFETSGAEELIEVEVAAMHLFDSLDEYLEFYLDDEEMQRERQNEAFKITLRKCSDDKWTLWCEALDDGKTVGEYILPFTPSPQNLQKFTEGLAEITRRAAFFKKTNNPQSVPVHPPAFGDLAAI
jgi:translation elongation factor EF-G